MIREAYVTASTLHTLMRGFCRTGVSPFNPDVFTPEDFIGACGVSSSSYPIQTSVEESGH
jgi:hypothetical protein